MMRNISGAILLRAAVIGMVTTASIGIAAMPAAAQTVDVDVNGRNVVSVSHNAGWFEKGDDGRWHEYDKNGRETYSFDESMRDDWSVYLNDPSRNVQLQIDLHRKMIGYGSNGGAKTDLYPITSSQRPLPPVPMMMAPPPPMAPPPMPMLNGRTVARVDFAQGRFIEIAPGKWAEYASDGKVVANFAETGRDDWSVYLNDAGRNVQLQLDLHRKMVGYGSNGGKKSDLYPITASR